MTSSAPLPLSFAHLGALDVGPPELIDMLAAAGFQSTTIRTRRTLPGTPEYPLADPAVRRATRERCRATGVSVLYVELVSLARDLDVEGLEPMLDIAAEIGATRVVAAGDDPDHAVVAAKLAAVCELAAQRRLAVDLEFMPFRAVRSLDEAESVIARAGAPNAHILVDALHFYRSGSSIERLRAMPRHMLGTFQICDAPSAPPADLAFEARNARLLPGDGALDLGALMHALPSDISIGVEVPLALAMPEASDLERARLSADRTRALLARTGWPAGVP